MKTEFLLGAAALGLSGCKVLDGANEKDSALRGVFESVSNLTYRAQRLLGGGHTLAPEYAEADIRQGQRPNGSVDPDGAEYLSLRDAGKGRAQKCDAALARVNQSFDEKLAKL